MVHFGLVSTPPHKILVTGLTLVKWKNKWIKKGLKLFNVKRALFKKNANMTYVVHIIKMNNFNLQPPPLWPAYRRPSLLSPPVFSLFFWRGGWFCKQTTLLPPPAKLLPGNHARATVHWRPQKLSKWRTSWGDRQTVWKKEEYGGLQSYSLVNMRNLR